MPRFLLVHVPSKQFEKNLLELFFANRAGLSSQSLIIARLEVILWSNIKIYF